LWLAVQTQWRVSFGGAIGLDYGAVFACADVLGIEMTAGLFAQLQALEAETLSVYRRTDGGNSSDAQ
jgi:hypothetical protein